jgi:hypothetical protein
MELLLLAGLTFVEGFAATVAVGLVSAMIVCFLVFMKKMKGFCVDPGTGWPGHYFFIRRSGGDFS